MTALRATSLVAILLTLVMIVLGAVIRTTGSGMSCPDWPTCYGHWVPLPSDLEGIPNLGYSYAQVLYEWVHRLIAGVILGPLVLVVGVLAFVRRDRAPRLGWAGPLAVVLLVVQATLGAVTVFESNSPWSVAVHLGNALVLLAVLIAVHDAARARPSGVGAPRLAALAGGALGLALLAMMSAAMTAKSGASLACTSWPLCELGAAVDWSDPGIRIHMSHRLLAGLFALVLLALAIAATRDGAADPGLRRQAWLAVGLVSLQVVFGALVIVLEVPVWKAVLHQATGVVTFVVVADLFWRARGASRQPILREPPLALALR